GYSVWPRTSQMTVVGAGGGGARGKTVSTWPTCRSMNVENALLREAAFMVARELNRVVQHLRRVVRLPAASTLSDAQLLEHFVSRRDEVAFEALLLRHGPMVLGLCRRVLRDPNDADDAFQATFLV